MNAQPAYSLWLLPREDQQQALAALVARLATRFATRAFIPHVTVQGDLTRRLGEITAVAADLARALPALRWRVRGIEQSAHYYRAFYLALDDDGSAFANLRARAAEAFASEAGLSPFAHLSLAYGTLDSAARDALVREFAAEIPPALTLDRLAVALSGSSVGVASWRTLQCFPLAQPVPANTLETSS